MEEAGQDVPSWLRGEADRFSKHEVQDGFEGVFISICHTGSNEHIARVVLYPGSTEGGRPRRRCKRRWKVGRQWMLQVWGRGWLFNLMEMFLS